MGTKNDSEQKLIETGDVQNAASHGEQPEVPQIGKRDPTE